MWRPGTRRRDRARAGSIARLGELPVLAVGDAQLVEEHRLLRAGAYRELELGHRLGVLAGLAVNQAQVGVGPPRSGFDLAGRGRRARHRRCGLRQQAAGVVEGTLGLRAHRCFAHDRSGRRRRGHRRAGGRARSDGIAGRGRRLGSRQRYRLLQRFQRLLHRGAAGRGQRHGEQQGRAEEALARHRRGALSGSHRSLLHCVRSCRSARGESRRGP